MKRSIWLLSLATLLSACVTAEPGRFASAPLVDLSKAPVSPSSLTEGKKEDAALLVLRAAKRENVAGADGFDALLQRQKARDAALIRIIAPDSPVTRATAKALKEELGTLLTGNVAPESADAVALQMVQSIFLNRRDDLTSIQNLYENNAWRKSIRARLEKGDVPELNVTLNPDKRDELKNTALYVHTPGKANGKIEPAVHLILTALAQQVGHAAIAGATQPGSPVHMLFLDSIAQALPDDPGAKAWLSDWLFLREGRARAVAVDFRADGELMQKAVSFSETSRRSRLRKPPPIAFRP